MRLVLGMPILGNSFLIKKLTVVEVILNRLGVFLYIVVMKRITLSILALIVSFGINGQTITNKKGEVFDIRKIDSGSVVEYDFYQQGIVVGRTLSVDGVKVFNFRNWKKLNILINGEKQNVTKRIGPLLIKFFSQQGFTVFSSDERQKRIPMGERTAIRNVANQIWIKD